ncbi:MAG: hypothetical protein FWD11_01415 [Micrococcales bacterium]|nr:hypothetical protein [Micrococcales bacterium]
MRRIVVDDQVFTWLFSDPECPWYSPTASLNVFHDHQHLFVRYLDTWGAITPAVVAETIREFVTSTGFVPSTAEAPPTENRVQRRRPHGVRRLRTGA